MRRTNQRNLTRDGVPVPASDVTSFRIFRQGYPYLEPHSTEPFRVGLNFVSFQNSPERLIGMLTSDGWLGRTNFGGLGPGAAVGLPIVDGVRRRDVFRPAIRS